MKNPFIQHIKGLKIVDPTEIHQGIPFVSFPVKRMEDGRYTVLNVLVSMGECDPDNVPEGANSSTLSMFAGSDSDRMSGTLVMTRTGKATLVHIMPLRYNVDRAISYAPLFKESPDDGIKTRLLKKNEVPSESPDFVAWAAGEPLDLGIDIDEKSLITNGRWWWVGLIAVFVVWKWGKR